MLDDAVGVARAGGEVLMRHFGRGVDARHKGDLSNVVTEADGAAPADAGRDALAWRRRRASTGIILDVARRTSG